MVPLYPRHFGRTRGASAAHVRVSARARSSTPASALGITLVELLIAVAIAGLIAITAVPAYQGYVEDMKIRQVRADFSRIDVMLERHRSNAGGRLPSTLAELGGNVPLDPYGRPYQFLNIENSAKSGLGNLRKDKNLVPLNSDYDLYSLGKDGLSKPPLTAKVSKDDIVRANNGGYVGLASEY